jgi:hypothetical protein
MFDPTIHARTIARHLQSRDFADNPTLLNPVALQNVIEQAVLLGINGLAPVTLNKSKLRGKDVVQIDGLAHNLVLRHVTNNIRRVTGVKQDDRQFIINCIASLVSEGTAFRVYKYDVKSFYESVKAQNILLALSHDLAFSGQSVRALESLFAELEAQGVSGLPRGLAISATLAEYLLRSFDAAMSNNLGVWYYSRFVDDILVITDGSEDAKEFTDLASDLLPSGLQFNAKSRDFPFAPYKKGNTKVIEGSFNFLGYSFSVTKAYRDTSDNKIKRGVILDIAPSKVKKIKTRMAKALLAYKGDGNFVDLRDRFRVLTSNFNFSDRNTGVLRSSGIYFNYSLISPGSPSLLALDKFARTAILTPAPKNKLYPVVSSAQRLELLRLSFKGGHGDRRFFSFKSARLAKLTACWHYA